MAGNPEAYVGSADDIMTKQVIRKHEKPFCRNLTNKNHKYEYASFGPAGTLLRL